MQKQDTKQVYFIKKGAQTQLDSFIKYFILYYSAIQIETRFLSFSANG